MNANLVTKRESTVTTIFRDRDSKKLEDNQVNCSEKLGPLKSVTAFIFDVIESVNCTAEAVCQTGR
jgi:hypothetical protein